ncbi:hypothetical protein ACFE04_024513 [Oxalis oulophora]
MTISDDDDESLAQFLESEVLSQLPDSDEEDADVEDQPKSKRLKEIDNNNNNNRIESGALSKVPPELFIHILKFLSCEDLISCSSVCKFLNYAVSDETLWRRLYYLRWGLLPPTQKFHAAAWKKLYIQRDGEDLTEIIRNCPSKSKEHFYYYTQMQAAKRSQAPLPSQVKDDYIILDKTIADQVSVWKNKRGLTDKVAIGHTCSGMICTYYQIGNAYICEKTGLVHVCDDTCREVILDVASELLVCTISGRCFDRLMSPSEFEPDPEQLQAGGTDEAEPFMGSGRFASDYLACPTARAYQLGYDCSNEKELEDTLRFC